MEIVGSGQTSSPENETAAFSHSGSPRVSRTELTRRNASPGEKIQLSPEKVGPGAGTAVLHLPGTGSEGCPQSRDSRPTRVPAATPHTLIAARVVAPSACALARWATPAHPAVIPSSGKARPFRNRTYGVERSAEKRRGDVRPPQSRSHPKGESRKNDRETRKILSTEENAAGQASSGLPFQIAWAHWT